MKILSKGLVSKTIITSTMIFKYITLASITIIRVLMKYKDQNKSNMAAQTCNPSTQESEAGEW
jgi:hypothetical protein